MHQRTAFHVWSVSDTSWVLHFGDSCSSDLLNSKHFTQNGGTRYTVPRWNRARSGSWDIRILDVHASTVLLFPISQR